MRKLLTLALVAGLAPFAFADGNTASASANATVTIFAPVTLTSTGSLNFGQVVVTSVSAPVEVDLSATGGPTYTNSAALNGSSVPTVPSFTGTKDASLGLTVSVGSSNVTKSCTLGVSAPSSIPAGSTSFSVTPTYVFKAPANTLGTVTGTVNVSVVYQ